MRRWLPLVGLALLLAGLPTFAEDSVSAEDAALRSFFETESGAERLALALRLTREVKDPAKLSDAIARARTWSPDVEKGETIQWERTTPDGVTHTVFAYAPPSYTPEKAWPLMVWLHGGVGRDLDGGGQGAMSMWQDEAEKKGFLIVSPSTQNGAHWWTPDGAAYVRGVILDFARKYRVDADKILATGFSDGGSGAYHLLAHDPSPYACFMPMMGNPLVSRIFGGPTWPQNLRSRPTYAVNGGKDQLYPSGQMEPFIDEMKEHSGAKLEWFDEPEAGHEPSFLQRRWDEMHEWWMAHPRDALPKELVWVSSAPEHDGRFAWVEIRELDPEVEGKDSMSSPAELGIPAPNPRPRLGIVLDLEAGGPGLRIREVQEGTPAAAVGFQPGDVIVAVGEEELGEEPRASVAKLRAFLDSLTDIDGVFVVKRGDEEVELETRPKILEADLKGPERPKALGYDVAPGLLFAKVRDGNVIDIDARGIGKIRVHLAEKLLDLDQELTIAVNGDKKFKGKVKRDPAYILAQAVEQVAGSPRYVAYIDVDVN